MEDTDVELDYEDFSDPEYIYDDLHILDNIESTSVVPSAASSGEKKVEIHVQNDKTEEEMAEHSSEICIAFMSSLKTVDVSSEMDLFNEIVIADIKEKETKEMKRKTDHEDLVKEVQELRALRTTQDDKISQLVTENSNLKRNICSLYKTAKSEIELKSNLLAEVNTKLDSIYYRRPPIPFQKIEKDGRRFCFRDSSYQNENKKKFSPKPKSLSFEKPKGISPDKTKTISPEKHSISSEKPKNILFEKPMSITPERPKGISSEKPKNALSEKHKSISSVLGKVNIISTNKHYDDAKSKEKCHKREIIESKSYRSLLESSQRKYSSTRSGSSSEKSPASERYRNCNSKEKYLSESSRYSRYSKGQYTPEKQSVHEKYTKHSIDRNTSQKQNLYLKARDALKRARNMMQSPKKQDKVYDRHRTSSGKYRYSESENRHVTFDGEPKTSVGRRKNHSSSELEREREKDNYYKAHLRESKKSFERKSQQDRKESIVKDDSSYGERENEIFLTDESSNECLNMIKGSLSYDEDKNSINRTEFMTADNTNGKHKEIIENNKNNPASYSANKLTFSDDEFNADEYSDSDTSISFILKYGNCINLAEFNDHTGEILEPEVESTFQKGEDQIVNSNNHDVENPTIMKETIFKTDRNVIEENSLDILIIDSVSEANSLLDDTDLQDNDSNLLVILDTEDNKTLQENQDIQNYSDLPVGNQVKLNNLSYDEPFLIIMDESTELENELDFECPRDEINECKNESMQGDNIEDFGTKKKNIENCVLNDYIDEKDTIKCDNNYHLFSLSQTIFTNLKPNEMETVTEGDQDPIINCNLDSKNLSTKEFSAQGTKNTRYKRNKKVSSTSIKRIKLPVTDLPCQEMQSPPQKSNQDYFTNAKNNLKKSNDKNEKLSITGQNVRHVKKTKSIIVKARKNKKSVNQNKVRSNNIESPQMTELELPKSDLNVTDEDKGRRAKEKQEISEYGDLLKEISEFKRLKSEQDARISEQSSLTSVQDANISQQAARISEQELKMLKNFSIISEQDAKISQELARISEQDANAAQHIARISEQEVKISQQEQQIFDLGARISEQEKISEISRISEKDMKISQQVVRISEQDVKISRYLAVVSEHVSRITEQEGKIFQQATIISEQDAKIMEQDTKISDQEVKISDLEAKISDLEAKISDQKEKNFQQITKLFEQDVKIVNQNTKVSYQNAKISEQANRILEQDAKVADQVTELSDQGVKIAELDIKIADQDIKISDQKAKISQLVTRISEQDITIADQDTNISQQVIRIFEQNVKIAEQDKNITGLVTQNNHLKRNICSLFKVAKKEIGERDKLLSKANIKQENVLTSQSLTSVQIPVNTDKDFSLKETSVESKNEPLFAEKSHCESLVLAAQMCPTPIGKSIQHLEQRDVLDSNCNSVKAILQDSKSDDIINSKHIEKMPSKFRESAQKSKSIKLKLKEDSAVYNESISVRYTRQCTDKKVIPKSEESLSEKDVRVSKSIQMTKNVLFLKSPKKQAKINNFLCQSDSSDVQSPKIYSKKKLAQSKSDENSDVVKGIDGKKRSSVNVNNDTLETCGEGGYIPIQTKSYDFVIEAMKPVESKSKLSFSYVSSAEQSNEQPPVQLMEISESNSIANVADNKSHKILKLVSNQSNNTVFEVQHEQIKAEATLLNEASSEQKIKPLLSEVLMQVNELNNLSRIKTFTTNAVEKHSSSEFIPVQTLQENFHSVDASSQNCNMKVSQEIALNCSAQIIKTAVPQENLFHDHCFVELKEAPEHGYQLEPNQTQYVLRSIEIDSNSPQKIFDLDDEKMKDPRLRARHAKIRKRLSDVTVGQQQCKEPENHPVKMSESSPRTAAADIRHRKGFVGLVPSHSRDPRLKARHGFETEPFFANQSTEQKITDFLKSIRNAEEGNSNDTASQMELIGHSSDGPLSCNDKESCDSVDSNDSLRGNPYIRDIDEDLKVTVIGDMKSENHADFRRVYKQVDVSFRHSVFSKRLAKKLNIDLESTSSSRFKSASRSSPSVSQKRIDDLSDEEHFSSKRMKTEFEDSDHEQQVSLTKKEKELIYDKLKRSSERCTGRKVMIGKPVKKIPELLKSDAVRLFHYKNTKVPFLVKRELKK